MERSFVFGDPRVCVGCKACMAACLTTHYRPGDVPKARINVVNVGERTAAVACHHCEDAPCAAACPVGALYNADDGRVGVHMERCIGCRSCIVACPYGAADISKSYETTKLGELSIGAGQHAVIIKCDLCFERENGPACVEGCTSSALKVIPQQEFDALQKAQEKQLAARAD